METPSLQRRGPTTDPDEVDGATGGDPDPYLQYSLFLPDPDSVDRLGSAPVFGSLRDSTPAKRDSSIVVVDAKSVVGPIDATDFIQGSVKTRRRAGTAEKRVVIDDSPPRVRNISPQPYSRLTSGLVSYQRPHISSSSTSRSRSGRRLRDSSVNERRTMHNLETSVKNASDLLERRRLAKEATTSAYLTSSSSLLSSSSSSPSSSMSPLSTSSSLMDVPRERGRDATKRSAASYARSSGSGSTMSASDESSISLRGLLDFAQSWLTTHKSRREVSMDRATQLLRRSRQF